MIASEVVERVVAWVERGATPSVAAQAEGIRLEDYRTELANDPEFRQRIRQASEEARREAMRRVVIEGGRHGE